MAQRKRSLGRLSIHVPNRKRKQKPVERLIKLGEERGRSVNYLVVEAVLEYLDREGV